MAHYAEAQETLDSYVKARVPLITVTTIEQQRALRLVGETASSPHRADLPFLKYTRATGLSDLRSGRPVIDDRSLIGAMDFAAEQFTKRPNSTFVFVDPDDLTSDTSASRHVAELARQAETNGGALILITDTPIWSGLQRLGMGMRLDLPNSEEMYETIAGVLNDHRGVPGIDIHWTEADARQAADFLVGVTEGEAINMLTTMLAKGRLERSDVLELVGYKDRIFGDLAGLDRIATRKGEHEVGGLRNLGRWLDRKQQLMVSDLRGTALRPPRGALLVGVPGCGKSLSAKAVAARWNLPLYRLDLASILGQYLGQSEGRLREALETADRVAPCVLWIDEIEKGLGAGEHDSTGVSQRLIGQFLFWLQESDSRVFVVATANNVQGLPPELLRKGRFDELFFVDLPDEDDRREIITLYHQRYLKNEPAPELLEKLVARSEGFAGSDIEAALHDVGAEALLNGGTETVSDTYVIDVFTNTMPLIRTNPEQIEQIRAWGRERAVPAGTPRPADSAQGQRQSRRLVQTTP
ncbi:AAA family ATPase [Nocardiopsis valliformis]|uniref:AAA family ATPase n=1 Tax=Nocardiopsis valliformis TaxID=239974 RepID=UPI00034DE6E1|nr:AAA family ATPase [Nocardiopsis valliformis]